MAPDTVIGIIGGHGWMGLAAQADVLLLEGKDPLPGERVERFLAYNGTTAHG